MPSIPRSPCVAMRPNKRSLIGQRPEIIPRHLGRVCLCRRPFAVLQESHRVAWHGCGRLRGGRAYGNFRVIPPTQLEGSCRSGSRAFTGCVTHTSLDRTTQKENMAAPPSQGLPRSQPRGRCVRQISRNSNGPPCFCWYFFLGGLGSRFAGKIGSEMAAIRTDWFAFTVS
ncbi:hypothetical protein MRX96_005600 [Rhipicephalus microplus]